MIRRTNILKTLCVPIAAVSLAACSDTLPGGPGGGDRDAIGFRGAPETRAAVNGFAAGDAFSVWAWCRSAQDAQDTPVPVFDAERVYTGDGSAWTYEHTEYWADGRTYAFHALFPDREALEAAAGAVSCVPGENGVRLTVSGFDARQTGEGAVDLMTARRTVTYDAAEGPSPVSLKFAHELARLAFRVRTQGREVEIVSFKVNGAGYAGDFVRTEETATWTLRERTVADDGIFAVSDLSVGASDVADLLGDMLVPPQTLEETGAPELTLVYRLAGEPEATSHTVSASLRTSSVTQWQAGQSYAYTLDLRTGTLVLTVTIRPWIEEDAEVDWKPSTPAGTADRNQFMAI